MTIYKKIQNSNLKIQNDNVKCKEKLKNRSLKSSKMNFAGVGPLSEIQKFDRGWTSVKKLCTKKLFIS